MMIKNNKQAFSLVELSIVIIIMGLLVASVTVGKDLIKAAQLRGLISQIQGFDTQVATFQLKYNALPGDINNADKRGLGSNNGDGDGVIEDADATPDTIGGEISYFWEHLNQAGFADGAYDGNSANGVVGETFPKAKHGGGITIYGVSGVNYFHVGVGNATGTDPKTQNFEDSLVPEDAFSVDNKIDDGFPLKGNAVARSASCTSNPNSFTCANTAITEASNGASQVAGTACVLQAAASQDTNADEYDFDTSTLECQLRIRLR